MSASTPKQWDPTEPWTAYNTGFKRTHAGKIWVCVSPQWAHMEPGSRNGTLGWKEIVDARVQGLDPNRAPEAYVVGRGRVGDFIGRPK